MLLKYKSLKTFIQLGLQWEFFLKNFSEKQMMILLVTRYILVSAWRAFNLSKEFQSKAQAALVLKKQ